MVIGEMKRLQVLAGIIDQYGEYFPNTEHVKLTESELQEFNEQWKIVENELDKDSKERKIPLEIDKRQLEIAKVIFLKMKTVGKAAQTLGKVVGGTGDLAIYVIKMVWKFIKFLWDNTFAVAVAAAVGLTYNGLIRLLDWVGTTFPRVVDGLEWFLKDVEIPDDKIGSLIDQVTRENIQIIWTKWINAARNHEGEWTWEILGDMAATVMEGIAWVTPVFIDWSVMAVRHFQENGFGWLGSITGFILLLAVVKGFWDLAMKIVSPVGNYIKKWIASQNIVVDIKTKVKEIEEPAGPPKEINPGGPISKDDAVKSISKPKPEIPGFKKSDDKPEVGVVKPEPK